MGILKNFHTSDVTGNSNEVEHKNFVARNQLIDILILLDLADQMMTVGNLPCEITRSPC